MHIDVDLYEPTLATLNFFYPNKIYLEIQMKIVALIPFWKMYETNEFRLKKIAGRFLMSYTLEKLNSVPLINEIFVYTSSETVSNFIEPGLKYNYLSRPVSLDGANVSIETVIGKFLETVHTDIVVLIHPTSPLLKAKSIQKALEYVVEGHADSSFSAVKYNKFAWFQSEPINYDLKKNVPNLQEVDPVYFEQSSLYVFKAESFLKNKHRISGVIKIAEIDQLEGLEVRNRLDFELVELIINSGLNGEL